MSNLANDGATSAPGTVDTFTDRTNATPTITDDTTRIDTGTINSFGKALVAIEQDLFGNRGQATINAGAISHTETGLSGFTDTEFHVYAIPNWNTTVWIDESALTTTQFKVFFGTPAPSGGGKLRWRVLAGS